MLRDRTAGAQVSERASFGRNNRTVPQDETHPLARSDTCAPPAVTDRIPSPSQFPCHLWPFSSCLRMVQPQDELIPTRATLIHRLKNWQDQASWQDFFDTYWRLIFTVAIQAGLTEVEAQDVVQETMVSVARHMPSFKYNCVQGSFKCWLLNMTRW